MFLHLIITAIFLSTNIVPYLD